eukprot:s72_g26.t1
MVFKGWIRMISDASTDDPASCIRAVKASVLPTVEHGPIGWQLDQHGLGVGRHYSNHFQDPALMDPNIAGPRYRTSLVKDKGEWFVLELCENLSTVVDLPAPFHEFEGERSVLTFISDGEKDPKVLGFAWADDDVLQPGQAAGSHDFDVEVVAPNDAEVQGIDIDGGDMQQQDGVEIQDRILVEPMRDDKLMVNGVELTATSSLAALRAGLSFYTLSTSGSKQKCFTKLLNHAKRLELETVTAAAKNAQMDEQRVPSAPPLAVPPSEAEQQQHALTHWPYASWCASCVSHRARQDAQRVDGRADPARVRSLTCLVMVCSQTGYVHCTPVKHKNQFDLMVRELLTFAQLLGDGEMVYMSDNEPTMLQLLTMVVNARLSMGLATRSTTSQAYTHGNSLAENAIGRVRALAGTFMHYISQQIGVEFSTSNALWSWALRHASWVLNRFNTNQGMSAYELVTGKSYKGSTCVFGEPLFGYFKTNNKGSAKWTRMLFMGKVDPQDSFILYNGTNLVLVKSVRRIKTDWGGHLAFYLNFKCPSFDYQSGFGGRVIPTKGSRRNAISASFKQPQGAIEPSAFFDADGAAVIEKAKEEKREELETFQMGKWDRPEMVEEEPMREVGGGGPSSGHADVPLINVDDQGYVPNLSLQLDAPRTPVELLQAPTTPKSPRASPITRAHGDEAEEEHDQKRSRVESHKKARVERLKEERSAMIRELWSDVDPSVHPSDPPSWIDQLADKAELHRLCKMGVLTPESQYGEEAKAKLTTRFVYDWRLKDYKGLNNDERTRKRWLRRSGCVAREYAFLERRGDTFAPASSTHVLNLLPMLWLQKLGDQQSAEGLDTDCDWVLSTLDVKDACLMVPQPEPLKIKVGSESFIVLKNLPGQRQGARSWYQFLRSFLDQTLGVEWCPEQPCLCRGTDFCLLTHVDDIMYTGSRRFWNETFLPSFPKDFTISYSELGGINSEVVFLKRRIRRIPNGLALIPCTNIDALVQKVEEKLGHVRMQSVPGDASLQREDTSPELTGADSSFYRMAVGVCLYLSRDRPDIVFAVKELASKMSKPTVNSMQSIRKLVGYLKSTQDYAVVLEQPMGGCGRWKQSSNAFWVLESFSDSDWSGDKRHRRSTSAGMHLLGGSYMHGSSRTQRVVSLSSCESELHGLVSTLADGIFLRRCAEFLTKATIEHILYTDSSSARQLAQRQGVGKIKHLDAKILWIQGKVQEKSVVLSQISTVWNVSDAGTKVLSAKRLKLLLHQLGMFLQHGDERVGQEEYDDTVQRGGGREVAQLARVVAKMMTVMGLGPVGAAGMNPEVCIIEDGAASEKWWFKFGVMILVMILLAFAVGCFLVRRYVKQLLSDLYHLSVQVAEADDVLGQHMNALPALRRDLDGLRAQLDDVSQRTALLTQQVIERDENMESLSDRQDGLHYGLIELGGFVRTNEISPPQRRHMYNQERGNMMARQTMGASQYLRTVRQQVQGFVTHGEDTDQTAPIPRAVRTGVTYAEGEGGESSNADTDEIMEDIALNPTEDASTRRGDLTLAIDGLRNQLNESLLSESWRDAGEIQVTILMLLDRLNTQDLRDPTARRETFELLASRMERLARRVRRNGSDALADQYMAYEMSYRNQMG